MASEWDIVRLGDVVELTTGFPFKSENYVADGSAPRLLRGDNIAQGRLRWEGVKRWPSDSTTGLDGYWLQSGDVVLAMDRPWIEAGLKYASISQSDLPALLVQRVARLRGKAGVETGFLRYIIGSRAFTEHVLAVQTGTAVPHISSRQIESFEFRIPSLHEQRAIARILGTLDDKIELNERMNEVLEGMARALYKSWFVDFDPVRAKVESRGTALPRNFANLFPDSFALAGTREIPTGWSIRAVGELATVTGGNTPSTREESYWDGGAHCWATPKDLSALRTPVLLDTERKITDAGLAQIASGLLPPGTVLMSSRAPIGYLAIAEIPVAINQGFIAMKATVGVSPLFLLRWAEWAHDFIVSRANGSTFLEISKSNFRPISVVTPPDALMNAFDQLVRPLYARVVNNELSSKTLAELRDALLPKLLSGELRIGDAEGIIGRSL